MLEIHVVLYVTNSFPHTIICFLNMILEPSFIDLLSSLGLVVDQILENRDLFIQLAFVEGWNFVDVHSVRTAVNLDFQFTSLMMALSFGSTRFLKESVFSQSQVDPNISQTLAT